MQACARDRVELLELTDELPYATHYPNAAVCGNPQTHDCQGSVFQQPTRWPGCPASEKCCPSGKVLKQAGPGSIAAVEEPCSRVRLVNAPNGSTHLESLTFELLTPKSKWYVALLCLRVSLQLYAAVLFAFAFLYRSAPMPCLDALLAGI